MSSFIYLVLNIFRLLIDLLATRALSDRQKDIEILLMRHQLFILFFIEPGTRWVHLAGCTAHLTAEWVTEQARNLM